MTTPTPPKRYRNRAARGTWWTLARRRWAYGILAALGAALVAHGIATTEQVVAWLAVGAALLGVTGLALGHPTQED